MPFAPLSKQQQEQQLNQPKNISGGGNASFQDVVPGQEKGQKSSGQYANLQQYIQANQPQSQVMGQKVAGDVQAKAQEAESKLGQFEQAKPQAVQSFDPNQYIQDAPSLSQEQKTQFQQQRQTGGYTGPQQLEQVSGYKETQQAAQKASDAAKMAGTESGQQELLKQTYARPSYTQGQVKLDQVLLGGNQQARQGLSDLAQRYSGLYDQFNTKAQDVGAAINQANQQALANKQAIEAAIPKAWQDVLTPIEQRALDINQRNPEIQQGIYSDLSDDLLLEDTLQRLGLSEGQNLYDLDLMNYLTPNLTELGANDVATAEERAKYQALKDLFQDTSRSEIREEGRAVNPVSFDKQKFDQEAQARADQYLELYNLSPVQTSIGSYTPNLIENSIIPKLNQDIQTMRSRGTASGDKEAARLSGILAEMQSKVQELKNQFKSERRIGKQT